MMNTIWNYGLLSMIICIIQAVQLDVVNMNCGNPGNCKPDDYTIQIYLSSAELIESITITNVIIKQKDISQSTKKLSNCKYDSTSFIIECKGNDLSEGNYVFESISSSSHTFYPNIHVKTNSIKISNECKIIRTSDLRVFADQLFYVGEDNSFTLFLLNNENTEKAPTLKIIEDNKYSMSCDIENKNQYKCTINPNKEPKPSCTNLTVYYPADNGYISSEVKPYIVGKVFDINPPVIFFNEDNEVLLKWNVNSEFPFETKINLVHYNAQQEKEYFQINDSSNVKLKFPTPAIYWFEYKDKNDKILLDSSKYYEGKFNVTNARITPNFLCGKSETIISLEFLIEIRKDFIKAALINKANTSKSKINVIVEDLYGGLTFYFITITYGKPSFSDFVVGEEYDLEITLSNDESLKSSSNTMTFPKILVIKSLAYLTGTYLEARKENTDVYVDINFNDLKTESEIPAIYKYSSTYGSSELTTCKTDLQKMQISCLIDDNRIPNLNFFMIDKCDKVTSIGNLQKLFDVSSGSIITNNYNILYTLLLLFILSL